MNKIRLNVNLPYKAKQEIRERMLKDGYGIREKSKWITEAIEKFIQLKDFPSLTQMASSITSLTDVETIYLSPELDHKLEGAFIQVRKEFPILEGIKSLIVRASVTRRLWQLNNIIQP
jgi:hypothetical protein